MTTTPTLWDAPRARGTDPRTSHLAAKASPEKLSRTQEHVMACLVVGPATHDELVARMADYFRDFPVSPQRIRTACKELESKGLVRYSGRDGLSQYGKPSQMWERVTP